MLALARGTNDAQKTMGVITLALIANGNPHKGAGVPECGDLRRHRDRAGHPLRRLADHQDDGSRISKTNPAPGFAAQTSGAARVLAASHFGYPLCTTHVINGGVIGAGAGKRLSAVC